MTSHTDPDHRGNAIVGLMYGLLFAVTVFTLVVLPTVLIVNGLGWAVLLLAAGLLLVWVRARKWRR
jgi:hypothetical protein